MASSAAVWAPVIASAAGGIASGIGGKQAAKGNKPQILGAFQGPVTDASRLLRSYISGGLPGYGGPFTAGLNPLQLQAMNFISSTLGTGDAGLQSALRTITNASEQGFSPQDIELARKQTQPLSDFLQKEGLAQVRESTSQGGRFFGTGGVASENRFMQQFLANRESTILPLAMQMAQYRLGAAQSVPNFLLGQLGVGAGAFQAGEAARGIEQSDLMARYQEFLRRQPLNAISALAGLMGGTPFYQGPVAPNLLQGLGAGLQGLGSSPGFAQLIQQLIARSNSNNTGATV